MDKAIINQPAMYRPVPAMGMSRASYRGYPYYQTRTSKIKTISKQPIFRYAKNYKLDKTSYCLCMITLSADSKTIEKFLDDQAANLSSEFKKHIKDGAKGMFGVEFKYLQERYESSV